MIKPEVQVSAIICTHNRDRYLGAAIDSLLSQEFDSYEVIVVDNGSTDSTRQVVEARLKNPRLRYIHEPNLGLSIARNTGANIAYGEILAYLDDDAIASPQWLKSLWEAYYKNPNLAIAGGRVSLIWTDGMTPPPWLSENLAGNLGAYNLGDEVVYIDRPSLTPRGLNYSIRKTFLKQIGGFDLNLGRVGKNLLSNEELHMTDRALKTGWQVVYLPEACVAHHVAPERIKRKWFLSRGWWQGISECYREQIAGEAGIGQFRRGGERFLRGLYKSVKFISNPPQCFENLVYSYGQIGYLSKALQGLIFSGTSMKRS